MILRFAIRNVLRQKRRSILTMLTMVGGFALASMTIGWIDGTYDNIIDAFTRNLTGHLQVHAGDYLDRPTLYKTIDGYGAVGRTIASTPGVEAWSPRVYAAGLASLGERSTAVRIIGLDPGLDERTTHFSRKVKQGAPLSGIPGRQAVLGQGLARLLKADIDSQVVVVSQAAEGSIANDRYRVVGISSSGDEQVDRATFYLHIADAQDLLALTGRAHELIVTVSRLGQVAPVVRMLRHSLSGRGLDIQPWQVIAKTFYQAMRAKQKGHSVVFFVVMLIVAIGVLNTVLMSVLERTREFGILKALGMRPRQVFVLIVTESAIMACASIVIGALLGTVANLFLSRHGIRVSPMDFGGMIFDTMKSEITARSITLPIFLVLGAALSVSIWPARRAARIDPARAMRIH